MISETASDKAERREKFRWINRFRGRKRRRASGMPESSRPIEGYRDNHRGTLLNCIFIRVLFNSGRHHIARGFPLSITRDIASEAVAEIEDLWMVDPARSIRTKDGFDWWPGDFKVSLAVTPRTDGHLPETWMLSVRTDFLKDIPVKNERFVRFAGAISAIDAITYAWVFPPAEVWDRLSATGSKPQLWFANTAYLTSENAWWLPRFLADMSIMQPINARKAASLQKALGGGVLNTSSPRLLGKSQPSDLLDAVETRYRTFGSQPNKWIATGEFDTIAADWDGFDRCLSNADDRCLVVTIGFDDSYASISLSTNQKHPALGNGLLGTLRLGIFGDMTSIAERCATLNLGETMWTDIPQFGCWHPSAEPNGQVCTVFSCLIPNVLYGKGIAALLVRWLYQRAQMVVLGEFPTRG
jgi:hypothetical protein